MKVGSRYTEGINSVEMHSSQLRIPAWPNLPVSYKCNINSRFPIRTQVYVGNTVFFPVVASASPVAGLFSRSRLRGTQASLWRKLGPRPGSVARDLAPKVAAAGSFSRDCVPPRQPSRSMQTQKCVVDVNVLVFRLAAVSVFTTAPLKS